MLQTRLWRANSVWCNALVYWLPLSECAINRRRRLTLRNGELQRCTQQLRMHGWRHAQSTILRACRTNTTDRYSLPLRVWIYVMSLTQAWLRSLRLKRLANALAETGSAWPLSVVCKICAGHRGRSLFCCIKRCTQSALLLCFATVLVRLRLGAGYKGRLAAIPPQIGLPIVNASIALRGGWPLPRNRHLSSLVDEVHERLCCEDSSYGCAPSLLDLVGSEDRRIVAHSFFRSFLVAGWRLWWMVMPASMTLTWAS